jgi:hypothetical protein
MVKEHAKLFPDSHLPRKPWFDSFAGYSRDFYTCLNRRRFAHAPTPKRLHMHGTFAQPRLAPALSPLARLTTCYLHVLIIYCLKLHLIYWRGSQSVVSGHGEHNSG